MATKQINQSFCYNEDFDKNYLSLFLECINKDPMFKKYCEDNNIISYVRKKRGTKVRMREILSPSIRYLIYMYVEKIKKSLSRVDIPKEKGTS